MLSECDHALISQKAVGRTRSDGCLDFLAKESERRASGVFDARTASWNPFACMLCRLDRHCHLAPSNGAMPLQFESDCHYLPVLPCVLGEASQVKHMEFLEIFRNAGPSFYPCPLCAHACVTA